MERKASALLRLASAVFAASEAMRATSLGAFHKSLTDAVPLFRNRQRGGFRAYRKYGPSRSYYCAGRMKPGMRPIRDFTPGDMERLAAAEAKRERKRQRNHRIQWAGGML